MLQTHQTLMEQVLVWQLIFELNEDDIVDDDRPTITKDSQEVKDLPEIYKDIEPAFLKDKHPKLPKKEEFDYESTEEQIMNNTRQEDVWLGSSENNTWAGFHSSISKANNTIKIKCKVQMLPLFRESAQNQQCLNTV